MKLPTAFRTLVLVLPMAVLIGFLSGCSLCGNAFGYEEQSPNGQLKAVAFERDCGATTSFYTHISILPSNQNLPNEAGNIWIAKGDLKVRLKWDANDRLVVGYPADAHVILKKEAESGVSVRYESLP